MEGTLEAAGPGSRSRRYWAVEEKRRMVEETLSSSSSVAMLARRHGVNANQLFYWRKLYQAGQLGPSSNLDAGVVRLFPVSVAEEAAPEAQATVAEKRLPGRINIEFPGRALVSVEGHVDPSMLRAVLDSLRG